MPLDLDPNWVFDNLRGTVYVQDLTTGKVLNAVEIGLVVYLVLPLVPAPAGPHARLAMMLVGGVAAIVFVVFMERAQRRITVNYARRQQGRKM